MASTKRTTEKPITMGSGTAYLKEFSGTIPEDVVSLITETCVAGNQLAYVKSGATVRYTSTTQTVSDDLGKIKKTIISEDGATMALGIMGWVGTTLEKLVSTARVSTNTEGNRRIVKIGGVSNDNGKSYVLVFHHEDKTDGDCWWIIVGKNTEGLELAYTVSDGTVVNPTFTAEPMDNDGTLVIYVEEIVKSEG